MKVTTVDAIFDALEATGADGAGGTGGNELAARGGAEAAGTARPAACACRVVPDRRCTCTCCARAVCARTLHVYAYAHVSRVVHMTCGAQAVHARLLLGEAQLLRRAHDLRHHQLRHAVGRHRPAAR